MRVLLSPPSIRQLDFCAGLDGALRSDGVCVVACFTSTEAVRHATTLRGWSVFIIARPQCRVVVDVFWAHSPLLGLINIVPQFVVILATVVSFARLDSLAAICLLPLVGWVAFAGILNTAIWLLNS